MVSLLLQYYDRHLKRDAEVTAATWRPVLFIDFKSGKNWASGLSPEEDASEDLLNWKE